MNCTQNLKITIAIDILIFFSSTSLRIKPRPENKSWGPELKTRGNEDEGPRNKTSGYALRKTFRTIFTDYRTRGEDKSWDQELIRAEDHSWLWDLHYMSWRLHFPRNWLRAWTSVLDCVLTQWPGLTILQYQYLKLLLIDLSPANPVRLHSCFPLA